MARKNRFSIAGLLVLIALVAACIVIYLDRMELAQVKDQLSKSQLELGWIDSSELNPDEGAIRNVRVEGTDIWRYRVYLPDNHNYSVEYLLGDPADPKHQSIEPLKHSGQFSIVIHKAVDTLKPNFQQLECFTTSVVEESNNPQTRLGIRWHLKETETYRDDIGHYTNAAGPNESELQTFKIGDSVALFRPTYSPKNPEGEMFYIRLMQKSKPTE